MGEEYRVEVSKDAAELIARLQNRRAALEAAGRAMDEENRVTVSNIQRLYLSFSKSGPTSPIGCRVITNRLRNSIRPSAAQVTGDDIVQSAIGSNVEYAAVQEFGFQGEVTVPPHSRKLTEREFIFGKRRNVRKGDVFVRSHKRTLNIEGRGFIQRGVFDRTRETGQAMSNAIVEYLGGAN